jgi:hypothetical protein
MSSSSALTAVRNHLRAHVLCELRVLALDALAENPAIESIAASVANDPSPMVRQRAQEILEARAAANRHENP